MLTISKKCIQKAPLTPVALTLQSGRVSVAGSDDLEWPLKGGTWMRLRNKSTFPLTLDAFAELDVRNLVQNS